SRMSQPAQKRSSIRNGTHDQLNNRIFFRLFQLGNVLQRQASSELGVTTVQWAVLGALSQDRYVDGMRFRDLAEYLVVSRQNLDGVLKRLQRDGLIERFADLDDRRSRIVRLTSQGREFWQDLSERIYEFYDQAAAHFKFDERIAFVHYLNELHKDLMKVKLTPSIHQKRLISTDVPD
ncbi:MarR family winged helix-turn-helix transcriptional regulator, partial [Methylobacterium frigidaeris]